LADRAADRLPSRAALPSRRRGTRRSLRARPASGTAWG
jgi:hypothetical protein